MDDPEFTIGIEEEYLLVDTDTRALVEAPDALFEACREDLGDRVSPEFLRCQIEVGTGVCRTIEEARDDLKHLRSTVAKHAKGFGIAPIAASCHPFADWKQQSHTKRERYDELQRDLAGVAHRMLICGMHVHVGIGDKDRRIDLMRQFSYFLPHLLALSASSPFWQGHDTGLASYRLTVFDNLPRTGLPPRLESWGEYERSVQILVDLGLIEDSSKIWWDLRPSSRFPTLESRICDVAPNLEDTLTLAALTQAIMRMLFRLAKRNQRWRIYDSFLVSENRWRAQRYGTSKGLIDFGERKIVEFGTLVDELVELTEQDTEALQSVREVQRAREMVERGTSAERQRHALATAKAKGDDDETAMRAVVDHLIEAYHADL